MNARSVLAGVFLFSLAAATGCSRFARLGSPPPRTGGGPAAQALAERAMRLKSVRADAVMRVRIPDGMEGAPGGKFRAVVLSAADPERARLEILTPLGTPAATVLLADGLVQVFQPFKNQLVRGPIDSPEIVRRSPIPVPLSTLPAMLRWVVVLAPGELVERSQSLPMASAGGPPTAAEPAVRVLEVRADGRPVQQVEVDAAGGYPVKSVHLGDDGRPALTVTWGDYGGIETGSGPIAFPQSIRAVVARPDGEVVLEIGLGNLSLDPIDDPGSFRLVFDRPPELHEFQ